MEETSNNLKRELRAVEFELEGHPCLRFFDSNGNLCVFGVDEAKEAVARYVIKYAPICRDQSLRQFLASIRPEADMNEKLHAILVLMEEHKDDMAQGMGISPDLVVKALDSFTPCEPMHAETLSLINALGS
jgi:hypothetical protein